jgi:hypothetical protein
MTDDPPGPARFDREAVLAAAGPKLGALQQEARAAAGRIKVVLGFAAVLPVAIFASMFGLGLGVLPFLAFVVFVAVLVIVGLDAAKKIFAARSKVLEAIAPALGLTYARAPAPIDLSAFEGTYYQAVFKHARCVDLLSGVRRGAAFQIFDATITARSKGSDGEWRYNEPPKWLEGVNFAMTRVVRVEVAGRWTARTVILRDLGVGNRLQQPKGMDPVRLADPRFEKIFEVYSTDQTEARALLDPSVMERLTALEELFAPPITTSDDSPPPAVAAFAHGALLTAIPYSGGQPWREVKGRLGSNAIDQLVIDQILGEIDAVLGVVDAVAGAAEQAG